MAWAMKEWWEFENELEEPISAPKSKSTLYEEGATNVQNCRLSRANSEKNIMKYRAPDIQTNVTNERKNHIEPN